MANPLGICGLCHEHRVLRESHLLPAAVYKLSRETDRRNPNPVVVRPTGAGTTSRQVSDHFLCADCEERFSRNGERYVLGQCARPGGQFALRELLGAASVVCGDAGFRVCEVTGVLGGNVEQYLYFAVSVFWRAAARRWTLEGRPINRISLGNMYQEQFRLYLLGQAAWPPKARLFVHVWSDEPVDLTTVFPCSTRVELARRHKFCIPGILFILFLGGTVPRMHDSGALNSAVGRFMWLCRWRNDSLFGGFDRLIRTAIRAKRGVSLRKR